MHTLLDHIIITKATICWLSINHWTPSSKSVAHFFLILCITLWGAVVSIYRWGNKSWKRLCNRPDVAQLEVSHQSCDCRFLWLECLALGPKTGCKGGLPQCLLYPYSLALSTTSQRVQAAPEVASLLFLVLFKNLKEGDWRWYGCQNHPHQALEVCPKLTPSQWALPV